MVDENTFINKIFYSHNLKSSIHSETRWSVYLSYLALFINNKKNKLFWNMMFFMLINRVTC